MNPKELKRNLKGVIAVQLFPFTPSGELDVDGLRENTEFLADFASEGDKDLVILTNGSTSEFYALSDKEQDMAIETVVEASGDTPVVAGASRAGTAEAVNAAKRAEQLGADGIMIVLPYYHQATKEGTYRHFETIAGAIDSGIMLYNNPFVSGSWVDPQLLARISKIDNVVAVKENTSSGTQFEDVSRYLDPEDMTLICGLGEKMYPASVPYGAKGFVSTPANFAPSLAYDLYLAGKEEDVQGMKKALGKYKPYYDLMDKAVACREETTIMPDTRRGNPVYQAMGKYGLDYVGLNGGVPRLPILGLTDEEKEELEEAFEEMGL